VHHLTQERQRLGCDFVRPVGEGVRTEAAASLGFLEDAPVLESKHRDNKFVACALHDFRAQ